jgi:hypothetical protein
MLQMYNEFHGITSVCCSERCAHAMTTAAILTSNINGIEQVCIAIARVNKSHSLMAIFENSPATQPALAEGDDGENWASTLPGRDKRAGDGHSQPEPSEPNDWLIVAIEQPKRMYRNVTRHDYLKPSLFLLLLSCSSSSCSSSSSSTTTSCLPPPHQTNRHHVIPYTGAQRYLFPRLVLRREAAATKKNGPEASVEILHFGL